MKILFSVLAIVLASANAYAVPASTLQDIDYDGIIEIRSFTGGGCSAALVRFDMSRDSDAAMVLTNGHCIESGMPAAGTYVLNKSSSRNFNILNPKDGDVVGKIRAEKIIYGTMTGTDMSLYKLTATFAEIEKQYGVRALTLSRHLGAVSDKIEIISGYWRRGYSCSVEKIIPQLKEGKWVMTQSMRYSRPGCETIHGTSGSPIILAGTRIIIGVNNTGNDDGEKCTFNNPCEIDENGGITAVKGYSYGQQINAVYGCLDNELNFSLTLPSCKLFGGAGN